MLALRDLMEIAQLDDAGAARPAAPSDRPPAAAADAQHLPRHPRRRLAAAAAPVRVVLDLGRALPARGERGSQGARDQDDAVPHLERLEHHRATCAPAARNGKQVAVVVELKARFDEAANIQFATQLEEAGIHVTYGVVGLKTHCKVILVVRQDYNGLRRYAHIGTGNYHAGTARLYTDFGLLTCDDAHRPGPHRAVQLPDHRLPAEAHLPQAPAGADAAQGRRCSRRSSASASTARPGARPDPDEDERARGRRHHARALPRLAGRREGRPDRARHLPAAARASPGCRRTSASSASSAASSSTAASTTSATAATRSTSSARPTA